PLTANGKVDRKALPSVTGEDIIKKEYAAPRNETEEKLAAIWQDVLGVEKIGITDNFFELGGNSIKVIKIIAMINKIFNVNINMQMLFKHSQIKDLAEEIENETWFSEEKLPGKIADKITI
ncbi:phosphopantetheine-binding protein, partial [Flavobacterium sp. HJSW_4]|uniref:phosphopantetheine-binding protein n=1 Tax=Flavobacterium sp. HJSW_4 TaxID=3344660 RepID=UPI0035F3C7D3